MMKILNIIILSFLCWSGFYPAGAQAWKTLGADELFALARTEVFDGKAKAGQEKLKHILTENPGYAEVNVFLARTYSWDGLYSEAREILTAVLSKNTEDHDAAAALIDVELWSGQHARGLAIVNERLTHYPEREDLLYRKANALMSMGRYDEALHSLTKLLQINPANRDAIALRRTIQKNSLKYEVTLTYGVDFFSEMFDPAQYASASASRENSWGSAHIRVNHARRFNSAGTQLEVDLYPQIINGIYAYLNYGYSEASLFPANRVGAELFSRLPHSLEASGGIRYMDFNHDSRILIYTGSFGWYFKNYWISVRPYLTPDPESGASASASLSVRRYLGNKENYFALNASLGFSPDLKNIQNGTGLSEYQIHVLKSQRTGICWQSLVGDTWRINLTLDFTRQELAFNEGNYVIITSSALSVLKRL